MTIDAVSTLQASGITRERKDKSIANKNDDNVDGVLVVLLHYKTSLL